MTPTVLALIKYCTYCQFSEKRPLMNEKALIEIFAGMASLVCLESGLHRDERRKIAIRVATIRRTKVGYQQIQRQNEMALSPPYTFTFAIDR